MSISIRKLVSKYSLTQSEEIVLTYILENLDDVLDYGVRKVAKDCFCSTSVVMHLAKKMNLKGFVDMVYHFKSLTSKNHENHEFINYFEKNHTKLEELKKILETSSNEAIYIMGNGFSKIISRYFQERLTKHGYLAFVNEHLELLETPHTKSPLAIIISESGETKYSVKQLNKCIKNDIKVISFTCNIENTIQQNSFLNLSIENSAYIKSLNTDFNCFFSNLIMTIDALMSTLESKCL
ncbi:MULTISPECIES: MurR/RpiR family transcriptional regulator [Psychrilyobacter]|uniref:SIS domain-containing protein n=1 Tax=Psychrilyobacter piezotolerans TaxID=2293438 RepID=A0ABX9KIH4_9FUSO|nr:MULTISPECIES: SIS domain-containing protein [Psychrilyobacter]MCS5420608.1 SIS domain-containing protein [Psychrilyobacter sp. S5]NDI77373.1 MurR/RpiR family transcriptional regulator [Psychrilyobacter piezotolerans]RDE63678.1 MurR/RpiR family transcriptional regulator [Psychrilyobacter sp. S5]REI42022.1 SIS domain-containing protein [Psychrilyobacter piezotolerans]